MSRKSEYEAKAEEILTPVAASEGVSVYDVEYVKEGGEYYLRGYIDKPDGVNIQDCENVSRRFSEELDKADFIEEAYTLEISSPGLGRKLTKDRHLQNSIGQMIEIKFYKPVNGQKELSGILKAFDDKNITITDDGNNDILIERADAAVIRLALDF